MMSFSDAEGEQFMVILGLALKEESWPLLRELRKGCHKWWHDLYPAEDGHSGDQVSAEFGGGRFQGIGSSLPCPMRLPANSFVLLVGYRLEDHPRTDVSD